MSDEKPVFAVEVLSPKLVRRFGYSAGRVGDEFKPLTTLAHYCPACQEMHDIAVDGAQFPSGATWVWDGNAERPTVNPSMKITIGEPGWGFYSVCHYFLHAGTIRFQGDCTHLMKGETLDLPDIPAGDIKRMKNAAGMIE